jgi:glycerate 2-kinase
MKANFPADIPRMKQRAREMFAAAVAAADPFAAVGRFVAREGDDIVVDGVRYPADRFPRVIAVGGGKASPRMAEALEAILGDRISAGCITTKYGHSVPLARIAVHECGHPVPDENGVVGAGKIIELLESADEGTLVLCLLSGGGSALMPAPAEGITLAEKQEVTRLLLSAGASIGEVNAVRKHLSLLKGGGMARLAEPARVHALILSDVVGDRLDTIASGPTVADPTTFGDCIRIAGRYGLWNALPENVRVRLERGARGGVPETAKEGATFLEAARATVIGDNRMSVEAAREAAAKMGYRTLVLSTAIEGEAREIGTFYAAVASEVHASGNPVPPPSCIIGGGETTVTVRGSGTGGRNQEMALGAAPGIDGLPGTVFLSGGTDGTDGPTDAAGGIVDGGTAQAGRDLGLDIRGSLAENDSYRYLARTGNLLVTGPTGTNVMDIQILLVGEPD